MLGNEVLAPSSTNQDTLTKKRHIKKVAVLGSGLMGSGIAAHCANIGLEVMMLDIVPFDLKDDEKDNKAARNRMADSSLKTAIKAKLNPFYNTKFASRITTGNFDDDFEKIADADWIIEVVVERLDIKQQVFAKVDKYRKAGSLVSSNTSGIPINMMSEGRSDDFKKHFCGTHFFNPVRYMRLLEVIPTTDTSQEVVDFFMHYGDLFLGKQTVLCKDTPAFIANRVGVYAMAKIQQLTQELDLRIEEVDALTGAAIGRPKTGTFRLGDLVGHDTSVKVAKGLLDNCPNDEQVSAFKMPKYTQFLVDNNFLGNKSGQGFYKKTKEKDANGRKIVLALNLKTLEYEPSIRPDLASLKAIKGMSSLKKKVESLFAAEDKGGELIRRSMLGLFAYVSNRVPEISDNIYSIDDALRAGFAWDVGPFQYWDMIGLEKGIELAEAQGESVGQWIKDMVAAGHTSFYKTENGVSKFFDKVSGSYQTLPGATSFIILDNHRQQAPVNKTSETILHDIGDGVLCLEFTSKMNSIGEGVLKGIQESIQIAEEGGWKGLVIGNNAKNFSVGANLMMIGMYAFQQEWDQLNFAVKSFQDTVMRCRYSSIPVVVATQGFVFGGACELAMHADAAMVSAESYIGLVEVGVGLIPGGAGTKEFAVRASDKFFEGDVMVPTLADKVMTIAQAKVATSAHMGYEFGYLNSKDEVIMNTSRAIAEAKKKVVSLAHNYIQPIMRTDITVLGRTGLAAIHLAANELKLGKFASDHDILIAQKIGYVMCGGDLTSAQQVSEQYLLDIEREAFLSLAGTEKTMARVQHMLQKNKPLRN